MMLRRLAVALLLLAPCALLLRGGSGTPQVLADAPVKDFRLPRFNEDGWIAQLLRADTAHIVSQNQIDVTGMTLTVFSGDANKRVDTVIVSPVATVLTETGRESIHGPETARPVRDNHEVTVHGPETVRLVRDNLEITGEQWSYFYPEKRVLIEKNARVVFRAKLPDLLK